MSAGPTRSLFPLVTGIVAADPGPAIDGVASDVAVGAVERLVETAADRDPPVVEG